MLKCIRSIQNTSILPASISPIHHFFFLLQAAAGTTSLEPRKINLESPNKGMHLPRLLCFKSLEWHSSPSPPTPRTRSFSALFLRFAVSLSPLPDCHHCMWLTYVWAFSPCQLEGISPSRLKQQMSSMWRKHSGEGEGEREGWGWRDRFVHLARLVADYSFCTSNLSLHCGVWTECDLEINGTGEETFQSQ